MHVALTGANGFIGQRLLRRLSEGGCRVLALTRRPPTDPFGAKCPWTRYALEEGLSSPLPEDCDAVIHCAHAAAPRGEANIALNVNAARALLGAAKGRPFVFVSSMSAHEGARSAYGRGKWAIEGLLRPGSDLAIKPGFVIGSAGIFARLRRSIRALPLVPLFYGGRQPIQTIGVDDLVEGIARAVDRRLTGTLALGSAEAITLRDFYRAILANDHMSRPLVPLPGGPSLLLLRLLEAVGIELPLGSENLLGLAALRAFDTKPSLELLDLRLVDLAEALRRAGAAQ